MAACCLLVAFVNIVIKAIIIIIIIIKPSRDGCDVVKQLKDIVHDNLNVFVGACVDPPNICLVWHYCPKGSLQVTADDDLFSFISVLS